MVQRWLTRSRRTTNEDVSHAPTRDDLFQHLHMKLSFIRIKTFDMKLLHWKLPLIKLFYLHDLLVSRQKQVVFDHTEIYGRTR